MSHVIAAERRLAPERFSLVEARATLLEPDGSVAWQSDFESNLLHDNGAKQIINVYLREQANVSKYLALANDGTLTDTDLTVADTTESKTPGSDSYNRQQIAAADWSVPALDSGEHLTSAAEKTFGPVSGSTLTVTHALLVTAATGGTAEIICSVALSASVAVGQSLRCTFRQKGKNL